MKQRIGASQKMTGSASRGCELFAHELEAIGQRLQDSMGAHFVGSGRRWTWPAIFRSA
jgi:hypothetical protein